MRAGGHHHVFQVLRVRHRTSSRSRAQSAHRDREGRLLHLKAIWRRPATGTSSTMTQRFVLRPTR